jgi:hypothetical protein
VAGIAPPTPPIIAVGVSVGVFRAPTAVEAAGFTEIRDPAVGTDARPVGIPDVAAPADSVFSGWSPAVSGTSGGGVIPGGLVNLGAGVSAATLARPTTARPVVAAPVPLSAAFSAP